MTKTWKVQVCDRQGNVIDVLVFFDRREAYDRAWKITCDEDPIYMGCYGRIML